MGEVYRARDPRLGARGRDQGAAGVVLGRRRPPAPLRAGGARPPASSTTPTSPPSTTSASADGAPYVVQELLEGETLRAALAGGRVSRSARRSTTRLQIAHGLAAAHEKGIVHRDLKPENLFVTKDGRVKILDFGLAKLTQVGEASAPQTNLPTATTGTEPGVVLGTLGYMSPEQVRGKPADARSDIFSFGAILYEMLSGKRAFHGDSAGETMTAILKEDPPDLSVTNQNISPGLERIVRHCLEKNPEQRFHSAHDLAFDLAALSGTTGQAIADARRAPATAPDARRRCSCSARSRARRPRTSRFAARGRRPEPGRSPGPPSAASRTSPDPRPSPTLSPDGQTVAFVHRAGAKTDIWVQRAGGRNPIDLTPDCDRDSYTPAFSPDGNLIAYGVTVRRRRTLRHGRHRRERAPPDERRKRAPRGRPTGRRSSTRRSSSTRPYGRTGTSELWSVDVASGKTRKLSGDVDAVQPAVSPHGLRIAYWGLPAGGSQRDIWTMPYKGLAAGEKPVPVTQDAAVDWYPVWGPDGKTLYFLSNRSGSMNLWRVPIDEATGRPLGPPEPQTLPAREVGGFALSRDGRRAAYVVRENTYSIDRLVFDAVSGKLAGKPEQILGGSQEMADVDVSPDGTVIAFDSRGGAQDDLFLVDSNGKNLRQITDDVPKDRGPSFSPDGKRIAFHSDRGGRYQIWSVGRDGSGLKPLTQATDLIIEASWSPDGRAISTNSGHGSSIIRLDDSGATARIEAIPPPAPGTFFDPLAWSPDGKTLAGSVIRLPDLVSQSLAVYSPGPGAVVRPVRGTESIGRVRRGAFLGTHFLLTVDRDLRVADLDSGETRVALERPDERRLPGRGLRPGSRHLLRRAHERQRRHLADDAGRASRPQSDSRRRIEARPLRDSAGREAAWAVLAQSRDRLGPLPRPGLEVEETHGPRTRAQDPGHRPLQRRRDRRHALDRARRGERPVLALPLGARRRSRSSSRRGSPSPRSPRRSRRRAGSTSGRSRPSASATGSWRAGCTGPTTSSTSRR